jgi:hypothetical protein
MSIQEVLPEFTPNEGREVWNANDLELATRLNALSVNVKTEPYNARGNRTADDVQAIQAAIDDVYNASGGYVFLPAGTYRLGASLILRDNVNIIGAGMFSTTLLLGSGVNQPVFVDDAVKGVRSSAFGRVYLSNFGIDGDRANNPNGAEGIFTSAYFSTFENLYIRNCQTHGIRMGFSPMSNQSSQNRVVGCRVKDCSGAGIYLDVNSVDHTIAQNYIHNCRCGITIRNGGIRVVNNAIYNNEIAGIKVEQTTFNLVIVANDLNGNHGHAIDVSRSTVDNGRSWSEFLISSNSILGDGLVANNQYDGIHVATSVAQGIAKLTIVANKVFTLGGANNFRYGINLENNVVQVKCAANHIHNVGTAPYFVSTTCSGIEIDSLGTAFLGSPALPPSATPMTNPYHVAATVYLNGGNVTDSAIDGQSTGIVTGSVRIPAGKSITLWYDSPPNWKWFGD